MEIRDKIARIRKEKADPAVISRLRKIFGVHNK